VTRLTERRPIGAGQVLHRPGEIGREIFLILTGAVALNPVPRNSSMTAISDLEVLVTGARALRTPSRIPGCRISPLKSMAARLRSTVDGAEATARPPALPRILTDLGLARVRGSSRRAGGDAVVSVSYDPKDLRHLHAVPWFQACTEAQLADVARLAERLRVHAGEMLTREGRIGRELFIILEGQATVTRSGRVINELSGGDYFGELAAIDPAPRSATVTATTDLDVLIIGPRQFEAMTEIPGFRNALLTGMSQRLRAADDALAAHAENMVRGGDAPGSSGSADT